MDAAAPRNGTHSRVIALGALVAVIAGLYLAREILIPLALATLLSFLLAPVVDRIERIHLGRVPSVLIATALALVPLVVVVWVAGSELVDLARALPQYRANIQAKLEVIRGPAGGMLDRAIAAIRDLGLQPEIPELEPTQTGQAPIPVTIVEPPTSPLLIAQSIVGPLVRPVAIAGIVLVFTVFMLVQREDLRDRLIRLISRGRITITTHALAEVGTRISHYLRTQLLINTGNGIVTAVGLLLIGVPGAVLWGALSVALRFIPYAGPFLSASMPTALALAVSDSWTMPLLTIGLFLTVELISNNIIEPWAYGSSTGISSVALLVAVIFWTWLWGMPGLLLATPLTVCLAVAGRYVPQLDFLNVLLGTEPVLPPWSRFYQRLLADDTDEALEIAEEYLKDHALAEAYDELCIRALRSADEDVEAGVLDDRGRQRVQAAVRDLVDDLAARADQIRQERAPSPAETAVATSVPEGLVPPAGAEVAVVVERIPVPTPATRPRIDVVVVPARDEADAVAGQMLGTLLARAGINTQALSLADLGTDVGQTIAAVTPSVLVVSSVPPFAGTQARLRIRQLSMRSPGVPQVAGLWGIDRETLSRSRQRMLDAGAVDAVETLAEAVERISALITPSPPSRASKTGSAPPAPAGTTNG
jgi:predicted PurR-regulated permease PerM